VDRYWRRMTIRYMKKDHPKVILDAATGTGDLAFAAARMNRSRSLELICLKTCWPLRVRKPKRKN
jgi:demethylmenaquinone methyltransferase/2-methoxy-6-polyprenyl-1,4-benzoquinol methylase